jgi:sn-glycerol 3-phosphate transport system substrate-binding protein
MEDQGIAFDEADYLPGRDLLLLRHRRQSAVAAVQLVDPGDVGEPRPIRRNDLEIPTTWEEVVEAAARLKDAGVAAPLGFGWQSWTMIENFSAWHDLRSARWRTALPGPARS